MCPDADDDRRALTAFRDAEAYERGRPGWPAEALDLLCAALGVDATTVVADVGAGTGKLTRELVRRARRVVAIEPSPPMLDVLRRVVPEAVPVLGAAEALPLPDASVHAAFVAEAFHWFGSPAVVAELARVVAPGGGLALLWNAPVRRPPIPALDRLVHRRVFPWGEDRWRTSVEASPRFGPLHERAFLHAQRLDRDGFVAQAASFSWIQSLPPAEREAALAEIAAQTPAEVVVPYRTNVFWVTRATGR